MLVYRSSSLLRACVQHRHTLCVCLLYQLIHRGAADPWDESSLHDPGRTCSLDAYVRVRYLLSSVTPQESTTSTQKLQLKSFTETSSHVTVRPSRFMQRKSIGCHWPFTPVTHLESSVLSLSTVVMTADKVLKVCSSRSEGILSATNLFCQTSLFASFSVVIVDLWLWCLKVSVQHHTHDGGGNLPLDGTRGHSEPTCVWDLRHLLLRCGELAPLNNCTV